MLNVVARNDASIKASNDATLRKPLIRNGNDAWVVDAWMNYQHRPMMGLTKQSSQA
jgi:hypothetical protein